ncbi:hypothetical protein H0W26_04685 [Candidatus Dependentiae bacterium]|nr:hypothetical protein [Candidatus Dependentiae bacterium]
MSLMRKYFMLSTLICSIYGIHAMDTGKPLIQSKPTCGGGLTMQLDPGYTFSCSDKKRNEVIKQILSQPEEILRENVEVLDKLSTDNQVEPNYFYEISQTNPVWALNECTGYCSLNRLKNPSSRKSFETIALQHLNTYYPHKEELLVYTSFAAGYLFSDFVLLTKLIENGYKHISINLIDTVFDEYVKTIQNESIIKDSFFDKQNHDKSLYMRLLTYRIAQLLSWVREYKDVHLTMHLYPDIHSYQKDCLNNKHLKANIFFAIDWYDEFTQESTFLDLHYSGMFKSLRDNGLFCSCKDSKFSDVENLFTFWLIKESDILASTDISFSTDSSAGEKYVNAIEQYCTKLTTDIQ